MISSYKKNLILILIINNKGTNKIAISKYSLIFPIQCFLAKQDYFIYFTVKMIINIYFNIICYFKRNLCKTINCIFSY